MAAEADGKLIAFVEIVMPAGWKTYWRNPGDAGGLPPSFDTSKSENVSTSDVLYPAPMRLADVAGETIGYKEQARFPIKLTVADTSKPVVLRVNAHFGVCKDICVPLQASYELNVAPGSVGPAEGALREALDRVPLPAANAPPGAPRLASAQVATGAPDQLSFVATYPGGGAGADLFIEAPDGLYVPMAKRLQATGDTVEFRSTFASAGELQQILGKPLKITVVSPAGQTVAETVVR